MKTKSIRIAGSLCIVFVLPAAADVIYSNLKDIAIPATFTGVYLDVDTGNWNTSFSTPQTGWDINPFFGGSSLWNAPNFQPVRSGTTNTSAVLNLASGTVVDSNSTFSTFTWDDDNNVGTPQVPGYGASETHMGVGAGKFTAGSEGYFGFKHGSNYGWMRVVFTNNASGALIKEWAYDNSGAMGTIAVGNITNTGNVVTANSANGNFSVGSVIADVGGTTSVVKTGAGTTDLNGANTYTGSTTITTGRLNINGSTHADSDVLVDAGATLGGDGVINGDVTLNGTLRAGQGGGPDRSLQIVGNLTANTGSSMVFNITSESSHDQLLVGSVDLSNTNLVIETFTDGSVTLLGFGAGTNFIADPMASGASFYELIDGTTSGMFANVTGTMSAWELGYYGLTGTQYKMTVVGQEFWVAQGSTYLVAIPEPSLTLLGSLGALLLLRRRR